VAISKKSFLGMPLTAARASARYSLAYFFYFCIFSYFFYGSCTGLRRENKDHAGDQIAGATAHRRQKKQKKGEKISPLKLKYELSTDIYFV